MHKPTWAMTLLSLATSCEKASAIEGDLIEEARSKGRPWFAMQILLVSLSLFRRALVEASAQTLLLGYAVYELGIKLQWWAIRPLRRMLRFEFGFAEPVVTLITLALWVLAGSTIGLLLGRMLPALAMRVAVVALMLLHVRLLLLDSQVSTGLVLTFGAFPLLATSLLVHRARLSLPAAPAVAI